MNLWPEGLIAYSDRADALVNKAAAGKNSADQLHPHFHIAFYIGQLAAKEPDACFHIISRDAGFDPLIAHLKSKKIIVRARCDRKRERIPLVGYLVDQAMVPKSDSESPALTTSVENALLFATADNLLAECYASSPRSSDTKILGTTTRNSM